MLRSIRSPRRCSCNRKRSTGSTSESSSRSLGLFPLFFCVLCPPDPIRSTASATATSRSSTVRKARRTGARAIHTTTTTLVRGGGSFSSLILLYASQLTVWRVLLHRGPLVLVHAEMEGTSAGLGESVIDASLCTYAATLDYQEQHFLRMLSRFRRRRCERKGTSNFRRKEPRNLPCSANVPFHLYRAPRETLQNGSTGEYSSSAVRENRSVNVRLLLIN